MNPHLKTFLKWLGFVLLLAATWFAGRAMAQTLQSVTHAKVAGGYNLATTVFIPDAQAASIIQSLGPDKTIADVKLEIGQANLDAVKRIVEQSEWTNKGRWTPYLLDSEWTPARLRYEAAEAEKKRIADSLSQVQENIPR